MDLGFYKAAGLNVCGHLIFGLPGETQAMMLETAKRAYAWGIDSVKYHPLYVVKRTALANVADNPKVTVLYNNMTDRIRWRFYGTAEVHESGSIREEVMSRTVEAELERDPDRLGVAVLIKVNKVAELSGNVLQER